MKNRFFFFLLLMIFVPAKAQTFSSKYFIAFTDKDTSAYSLSRPGEFLSERAIERRKSYSIPFHYNDLPVSKPYTDSLKKMGFHVYYTTKWFNGAVVGIDSNSVTHLLNNVSFIKNYELIYSSGLKSAVEKNVKSSGILDKADNNFMINYGPSKTQIAFNNGDSLHNEGLTGKGIYIAILDAGFFHVDTLSAFARLWSENQILTVRDFVNPTLPFFESHTHGMYVLSLMGGWIPGKLIGSAPDATYILVHTEDASSENRIEEYNWAAGAEFADSIGVDIINSSLGYSNFDLPQHSYTYDDMDGNTAVITRAADIAASKGLLVVTSAGNEGNDPWKFITAPADADSVLTVGAADSLGFPALFTSYGPTRDGRIKPNTTGMGVRNLVQSAYGGTSRGNGTSFSAPLIAGMAAGLMQKYPYATNVDIIKAIEESSSLFMNPDSMLGYGIADMSKARLLLNYIPQRPIFDEFTVYPNPFIDHFTIESPFDTLPYTIEIINLQGKMLAIKEYPAPPGAYLKQEYTDFQHLPTGVYILTLKTDNIVIQKKIIKYRQEK